MLPDQTSLLLLADWKVMELPLETLRLCDKAASVARDFSAHVFYSRVQKLVGRADVGPIP